MHKTIIATMVAAVLAVLGWMGYVMLNQQSTAPAEVNYPTKFFDDEGNEVTVTPSQSGTQPTGTVGTNVQDMNVELQGTVDDGGLRDIEQVTKDSEGL